MSLYSVAQSDELSIVFIGVLWVFSYISIVFSGTLTQMIGRGRINTTRSFVFWWVITIVLTLITIVVIEFLSEGKMTPLFDVFLSSELEEEGLFAMNFVFIAIILWPVINFFTFFLFYDIVSVQGFLGLDDIIYYLALLFLPHNISLLLVERKHLREYMYKLLNKTPSTTTEHRLISSHNHTKYSEEGVICPKCKQKNILEAKFCINCKHDITTNRCFQCFTSNDINAKYCLNCGMELVK